MPDHVQCPNCGGYKVNLEEKLKAQKTEQEKIQAGSPGWAIAGGCVIVFVVSAALWFLFLFLGSVVFRIPDDKMPTLIAGIILGAPILGVGLAISLYRSAKRKESRGETRQVTREVVSGYRYYCYICGNRWTWMVGTPLPEVTVRPDLLAKAESQRWTCAYCGSSNEGYRRNCSVCTSPRP